MAAEELLLLNLFDSNWFGHTKSPYSQSHQALPQEKEELCDHGLSFSVPQSLKVRSLSEQLLEPHKLGSFFSSDNSLSPSSVLADRKLQTIFSGKEARDFPEDGRENIDDDSTKEVEAKRESSCERRTRRRKKKRASKLGCGVTSKSLSELEFEELKGFMDLGFVFTEEECKDSKLVSMIPGLQTLCKKCTGDDHPDHHNHHHRSEDHDHDLGSDGVISRPYLSEAWDVLEENERKKSVKPLVIDWKITALENEIYMKDQLKFWAHTVASTVR